MDAAIIAGAGPGLGSALARGFARQGFSIALISRQAESSEPVARELAAKGVPVLVVPTDVADFQAVRAAVATVKSKLGEVTVLAYNAGAYGGGAFLDLDPAVFRSSFDVGVMGAVHFAQSVIPDMLRLGRGFISFTGATAALRGKARFAPLAVSKAGLRMLAQSLAREFHPRGIHVVHVIVDGQIDTPKLRDREPGRNPQTTIDPDAIANCIIGMFGQPARGWSHEIDIRPNIEPF